MTLSALFIGNESLLIQCADIWRARGHAIAGIVTRNAEVRRWAEGQGVAVQDQTPGHATALAGLRYDWLLSIANLSLVPESLITQAAQGAVNFHDGPLPRHAGLNAPVWAILEGETEHGITWHRIAGGIDEGGILEQRPIMNRATGKRLGVVTCSIGVAQYRPGEPVGEVVDRADQALYRAKREGRNRVCAE